MFLQSLRTPGLHTWAVCATCMLQLRKEFVLCSIHESYQAFSDQTPSRGNTIALSVVILALQHHPSTILPRANNGYWPW